MKHKIHFSIILGFLFLQSTIVYANNSLENDLSEFVDSKFQSEKYEGLDFYDFDMVEDFNPENIRISEDMIFNSDEIKIEKENISFPSINLEKDSELALLEKNYQSLKNENTIKKDKTNELNLIPEKIINLANTIPLLKTKHATLVKTKIKKKNYYFIKFLKPQKTTVSFKQLATLSVPEQNTKNIKDIERLSNNIKSFNKTPLSEIFVTKNKVYIPLKLLKFED